MKARATSKTLFLISLFIIAQVSSVHAIIISDRVESIVPAVPLVGKKITVTVAITEDVKLRTMQQTYRYKNTKNVEFINVFRTRTADQTFIKIIFRAKKSGTIDIPDIYENNYKIQLPIITVASSISNYSSYAPLIVSLPLLPLLYAFLSVVVLAISVVIIFHIFKRFLTVFRFFSYSIKNYFSFMGAVSGVKKMLKILNRIGTPKMKSTCTTQTLYSSLGKILRKRLEFLLGFDRANAKTYTEVSEFLLQEIKSQDKYFKLELTDFFSVINEVEYGTHSYPLEIRKKHCSFLIDLLKALKNYKLEATLKSGIAEKAYDTI